MIKYILKEIDFNEYRLIQLVNTKTERSKWFLTESGHNIMAFLLDGFELVSSQIYVVSYCLPEKEFMALLGYASPTEAEFLNPNTEPFVVKEIKTLGKRRNYSKS